MKKKNIGPKIVLIVFALFVIAVWGMWIFRSIGGQRQQMTTENREMNTRPVLSLSSYKDFSKQYEAYFNDNMPFRYRMILANTALDYFVFNKSSNESVEIGKDGWLFYSNVLDGDPIKSYQGQDLFTGSELEMIADNCLEAEKYLKEQGCEFVLFIAPNKERIYSEYMPDKYKDAAPDYAAAQLTAYLRENTDIKVVYPYDEIISAKSISPVGLWYKTDTHWNNAGGYVGAKALLEELGTDIPGLEDLSITCTGKKEGDLAGMINLTKILKKNDDEISVAGYGESEIKIKNFDFLTTYEYECESADPRKIFILRDSFCNAMADVIGCEFSESYMVYAGAYDVKDLEREQPDIFVYETVERYLRNLLTFKIDETAD